MNDRHYKRNVDNELPKTERQESQKRQKSEKKKFSQKRILEMKINETENQLRNKNMKGGKTNEKIEKQVSRKKKMYKKKEVSGGGKKRVEGEGTEKAKDMSWMKRRKKGEVNKTINERKEATKKQDRQRGKVGKRKGTARKRQRELGAVTNISELKQLDEVPCTLVETTNK